MSTRNLQTVAIRVSDIMSNHLVTVQEYDRVSTTVRLLLKGDVGSVLVMDREDHAIGIVTKGDVLREVVMNRLDPDLVKAREIMSSPVITIGHNATIEDASKLMIQKKISKLPVLKDGHLMGIVTATDIIRTQPIEVSYLEELIRARFVPRDLR